MYVLISVNVSMMLQSMWWWIFCVGIPHTTWGIFMYLDLRAIAH